MERAEALRILEEAECLAGQSEIESAICRIASEITSQIGRKNPVVICVMNGGLIFCGQLLTRLHFPLEVTYLHATRYGMETTGGEMEWKVPLQTDVSGRTVLLVDDILDEGVTLHSLADECRSRGAKEVVTTVLVDKQHQRKVKPDFRADFTGIDIPDRFVFGYGLDYDGMWRNADRKSVV